jgi:hypothetical protein
MDPEDKGSSFPNSTDSYRQLGGVAFGSSGRKKSRHAHTVLQDRGFSSSLGMRARQENPD